MRGRRRLRLSVAKGEVLFFLLRLLLPKGWEGLGAVRSLMVDGDVVSMVTDFFSSRSAAKSSSNNKNPSQLSLAFGGTLRFSPKCAAGPLCGANSSFLWHDVPCPAWHGVYTGQFRNERVSSS